MFHKVRAVNALEDLKLSVQFCEGVTAPGSRPLAEPGHNCANAGISFRAHIC